MIKIICVGKLKEKYLKDAIKEYEKRLTRYTKLEIIEINDESLKEKEKCLDIEGEKILKNIKDKDYVITLEIEGEMVDSVEFSKKIDILSSQHNITFIIGGSYGISNQVKKRRDHAISFSKMTFPHQLFRIFLLEQIYRGYKIKNNESYHK